MDTYRNTESPTQENRAGDLIIEKRSRVVPSFSPMSDFTVTEGGKPHGPLRIAHDTEKIADSSLSCCGLRSRHREGESDRPLPAL